MRTYWKGVLILAVVAVLLVGSASAANCTIAVTKVNATTGVKLPGWEMKVWIKNTTDGSWSRFTAGNNQCIRTTGALGVASFQDPGCLLGPATYKVVETPKTGWYPVAPFTGESGELVCPVGGKAFTMTFNNSEVTCEAPIITAHPEGKTKGVGESVTFSVSATGSTPLSFQWYKDGVKIDGATGSSYTISPLVKGDAGTYTVVVSNSCGSKTSNGATLTVVAYCTIAGTKFDATSGDKLPGWEMKVYVKNGDGNWIRVTTGTLECIRLTGAEGGYSFNSPACLLTGPATYKVVETMQDGWSPVDPASGETDELFCPEDGAAFIRDFRNEPTPTVIPEFPTVAVTILTLSGVFIAVQFLKKRN